MTTGVGVAGVAGTLALVLALVLLLAKVARRWLPAMTGGQGDGVRVVQRVALGQKQSIAVVEVGGRRIALGIGDGGVRQLFTLDEPATAGDAARPAGAAHAGDVVRDARPAIATTDAATRPAVAAVAAPVVHVAPVQAAPVDAPAPSTRMPTTMTPVDIAIDLVPGKTRVSATPVTSAAAPSSTDWLRKLPARTPPAAAPVPPVVQEARVAAVTREAADVPMPAPRRMRATPVRMPSAETLAALPAPLMMPTPLVVPAIAEPPARTLAEIAAQRAAQERTARERATRMVPPREVIGEVARDVARSRGTQMVRGSLDDVFAAAERLPAPAPRPAVDGPRAGGLPAYVQAAMAITAMKETPTRGATATRATPAAPAVRTPIDVRDVRDDDGAIARTLAERSGFAEALALAMRKGAAVLALAIAGALVPHAAQAQAAAPAAQAPAVAPARTTPAPASGGDFRTLPAPEPRPGPRDLPRRAEPTAVTPRPDRPARTAASGGGVPSIAPLVPAATAARIVAEKQKTAGTAPLTTPEAKAIERRADSALAAVAPTIDLRFGKSAGGEGLRLSGTVGVVIMMGVLSLLPFLLLMMTAFTRVLVVLSFLKQALGTQGTPPGQLVAALALVITGFVMAPTMKEVNAVALEPWLEGRIEQVEMMQKAVGPFRGFMLSQVGDKELQAFVDLAEIPQPKTREEVPLMVLMSAFVTSELRTSFQIGFALFLPFIIVDVVVSSVLMSMGMMMLPPAMVSLPFKLLLFVLVDGWTLVVSGLVQSFR